MTTFRVDSQDFREFISWLIEKAEIQDNWEGIGQVYEKPWHWEKEYYQFQKETYGNEVIVKAIAKKEVPLGEMGVLVKEIQALYAKGGLVKKAMEEMIEEMESETEELDLAELGLEREAAEEGWADQ